MTNRKIMCNGYIQRHKPTEMTGCDCGENRSCGQCGFGYGQIPCECSPHWIKALSGRRTWDDVAEDVLEEHAALWKALSKV